MSERITELYVNGYTVMEIVRDLETDATTVAQCLINNNDLLLKHRTNLKARCQQYLSDGYSENAISKIVLIPIISIKKILEDKLQKI